MKTGVPVVPGTPGPVESYDKAESFIKEYGFPVIIKAAMGGGGRGMRVVRDQATFKENFERAVSEAKSAFGDGTVFIEREWARGWADIRLPRPPTTYRGTAAG